MKTIEQSSLESLGFQLEVLSGPYGHLWEDWPCIKYTVALVYKGRQVLKEDYHLGVGHVKLPKNYVSFRFAEEEQRLLDHWIAHPHAQFTNKQTHADVAAKLAGMQKVKPNLPEVLHSLLLDSEASEMLFEEWADSFGYDKDSRKAERVYRQCDQTGKQLKAIPANVREQAKELLKDL